MKRDANMTEVIKRLSAHSVIKDTLGVTALLAMLYVGLLLPSMI